MIKFEVRTPRTKVQNILVYFSIVMFILNVIVAICYGISFGAVVNSALFIVIFLSNYFVRR